MEPYRTVQFIDWMYHCSIKYLLKMPVLVFQKSQLPPFGLNTWSSKIQNWTSLVVWNIQVIVAFFKQTNFRPSDFSFFQLFFIFLECSCSMLYRIQTYNWEKPHSGRSFYFPFFTLKFSVKHSRWWLYALWSSVM